MAVAAVTLRDLATRRLSPNVPSLTVALAASVGVTIFGAVGSTTVDWSPLGTAEVLRLTGTALFILAGYTLSVVVMRSGEISFIAPFRYTSLIWALILGWFVFNEWPDGLTLLGALIVASTGAFTLWREQRVMRRRIATQVTPRL